MNKGADMQDTYLVLGRRPCDLLGLGEEVG